MTSSPPNPLELSISQRLQAIYSNCLGHNLHILDCHLAGNRAYIVADKTITRPEELLLANGQVQLAEQIRGSLEVILCKRLEESLKADTRLPVQTVLWASDLQTGYSSVTVMFN